MKALIFILAIGLCLNLAAAPQLSHQVIKNIVYGPNHSLWVGRLRVYRDGPEFFSATDIEHYDYTGKFLSHFNHGHALRISVLDNFAVSSKNELLLLAGTPDPLLPLNHIHPRLVVLDERGNLKKEVVLQAVPQGSYQGGSVLAHRKMIVAASLSWTPGQSLGDAKPTVLSVHLIPKRGKPRSFHLKLPPEITSGHVSSLHLTEQGKILIAGDFLSPQPLSPVSVFELMGELHLGLSGISLVVLPTGLYSNKNFSFIAELDPSSSRHRFSLTQESLAGHPSTPHYPLLLGDGEHVLSSTGTLGEENESYIEKLKIGGFTLDPAFGQKGRLGPLYTDSELQISIMQAYGAYNAIFWGIHRTSFFSPKSFDTILRPTLIDGANGDILSSLEIRLLPASRASWLETPSIKKSWRINEDCEDLLAGEAE